jgi:hypothetical protein
MTFWLSQLQGWDAIGIFLVRPGTLLSMSQCTGPCSVTKNYPAQNATKCQSRETLPKVTELFLPLGVPSA